MTSCECYRVYKIDPRLMWFASCGWSQCRFRYTCSLQSTSNNHHHTCTPTVSIICPFFVGVRFDPDRLILFGANENYKHVLVARSKFEPHPNLNVDLLFTITSDQSPPEAAHSSAQLYQLPGSHSCACPDAPTFSQQSFLILFTCQHHDARTKNKDFFHPCPALFHSNFFSRSLNLECQQNKSWVLTLTLPFVRQTASITVLIVTVQSTLEMVAHVTSL